MDPHIDRNHNLVDPMLEPENISPVCSLCPPGLLIPIHNRFHNPLIFLHLLVEIDLENSPYQDYFRDREIEIRNDILKSNSEFEIANVENFLQNLISQVQSEIRNTNAKPRLLSPHET